MRITQHVKETVLKTEKTVRVFERLFINGSGPKVNITRMLMSATYCVVLYTVLIWRLRYAILSIRTCW